MPPRRQNRRNVRDVELNELRQQMQRMQEDMEAERARIQEQLQETQAQLRQAQRQRVASDSELESEEENPFHNETSSSTSTSRHRQRPFPRNVADNFRVEIPEFEGKLQPDDFVDWLYTVERIFELKEIPDEQRVKIVAIKLKKHASIWWENLKRRREREGKNKIRTWEKMRRELTRKFLPDHYYQDNFIKLQNLKQKSKTVEEYTMEFEQLMMKCDIREKEEQTIARYLGGLNFEISKVVQLQQYWNLDDVTKLAIRVEGQLPRTTPFQSPLSQDSTSIQNPQPLKPFTSNKAPPKQSREPNSSQQTQTRNPKCFKCQGFGHIASDCPNRRVFAIIGEEVQEPSEEEKEKEKELEGPPVFDEELIPPDYGELLIVRRSLHTSVAKEEPWLRHNIFHTRCTTQGKVCNVIIDSGSCENVVSNSMVEKLKLPTHAHPHPYKLQWLKKENEVKVTKCCLVSFSIGKKYHDEVWCDVIPMDACHLLLGRPWQFDRQVIHDGYNNTYSFIKDEVKVKLTALQPNELIKQRKAQTKLSPYQKEDFKLEGEFRQPRENSVGAEAAKMERDQIFNPKAALQRLTALSTERSL